MRPMIMVCRPTVVVEADNGDDAALHGIRVAGEDRGAVEPRP